MAEDSTNSISYYLSVNKSYIDCLGAIRHLENPKLGFDKDMVWVKELDEKQVESIEVQSIPNRTIYYVKDNKLFIKGSLLPSCNIPSLLWTPITRALPLTLPTHNNNYFGVSGSINIQLIESDSEQSAVAIRSSVSELGQYIDTAPAVRLSPLQWILVGESEAIVVSNPILPIKGVTYWVHNNFLIPTGYAFNFPILADELCTTLGTANEWILWATDNSYTRLKRLHFSKLTIGSFRQTIRIK